MVYLTCYLQDFKTLFQYHILHTTPKHCKNKNNKKKKNKTKQKQKQKKKKQNYKIHTSKLTNQGTYKWESTFPAILPSNMDWKGVNVPLEFLFVCFVVQQTISYCVHRRTGRCGVSAIATWAAWFWAP